MPYTERKNEILRKHCVILSINGFQLSSENKNKRIINSGRFKLQTNRNCIQERVDLNSPVNIEALPNKWSSILIYFISCPGWSVSV